MNPDRQATASAPTKAVSYVRISTQKQAQEGDGLRSQSRSLEDYARYKGLEIVEVFADVISGKYASRPGMGAMLDYLRACPEERHAVLVHDIARLARDIVSHTQLRAEISAAGGVLMSPSIEFSDDPVAQLPEKLQAVIVEHDRISNARRSASRQKARTLNGYWTFYPGPALEYVESKAHRGKHLVRKEPEATVLAEALNGFATGRFETQMEVKRFLDAHPDFPKGRTGKLPKQNIRKLLTNILYTGYVEYKPWGVPLTKGHHEPIISLETHFQIVERLSGKAKFPIRKSINEDFPIRGCVDCADCDKPLRASWSQGRRQRYGYYVCQTVGCSSYGKSTPKAEIEGEFDKLISAVNPRPEIIRIVEMMIRKAWEMNLSIAAQRKRSAERELREIERQIDTYLERIVETMQPRTIDAYEAKIEKLERERVAKSERIAAIGTPKRNHPKDFDETYRTVMNFIAKPSLLWRSGRIECQRAAIKYTMADRLKWCRRHGYRTTELSLPFKLLGGIMTHDMGLNHEMVPHR